jgi:hypothetical protein
MIDDLYATAAEKIGCCVVLRNRGEKIRAAGLLNYVLCRHPSASISMVSVWLVSLANLAV